MTLIQLSAPLTVTDGGLETTLVFHQGIDLPDFAAFPLLDTEDGRAALAAYYEPYLDLGRRLGAPVVVDTPTWRANLDWGARSATTRSGSPPSTDGPWSSWESSPLAGLTVPWTMSSTV